MTTPPQQVFETCMSGLAAYKRASADGHDVRGASGPAVRFAERVYHGHVLDPMSAAELLDAHRTIDEQTVTGQADPTALAMAFRLWGGEQAPSWARRVLETARLESAKTVPPSTPAPLEPVAAELQPDETQPLIDRLDQLDDSIEEQLAALFWLQYRTLLRRTTAIAAKATHRVPKQRQIDAGWPDQALNEAKARLREAHPYEGWNAVGRTIMAELTPQLEAELEAQLEDFAIEAERILQTAGATAAGLIAQAFNETIPDAITQSRAGTAARFLADNLLEWVRARLSGDRDPEDLDELVIPTVAIRETLAVAAGAEASGLTVARDAQGLARDSAGRNLGLSLSAGLLRRTAERFGFRLVERYTWDYGNPASRETPFEDHVQLDGLTWTDDTRTETIGSFYEGDHFHCQCRERKQWRIERTPT